MEVAGFPSAILAGMSHRDKMIRRLLGGRNDQDFRFDDLCVILRRLGFDERHRSGSHHIFTHPDIPDILNLQPGKHRLAKPYQVRQVRRTLLEYEFLDATGEE
jgi:predicted RNA binding protein YcfA (HicA-like mRNA interferase family)